MMVLITYDVSTEGNNPQKRLRQIANACLDCGVRVQYSVFECEVTPDRWVQLQAQLFDIYDSSVDSLRFYKLGKNWRDRVEHHGAKPALDIYQDTLIL